MIALGGWISLVAAAACAVAGLAACARPRGGRRVVPLAAGMAVAVTGAVALLEWALIGGDFSIRYVAATTNRTTPLAFRVAALWGALEGSLLLWTWLLAALTAGVAVRTRAPAPRLWRGTVGVLLGLCAFFLLLLVGPADPFARVPTPPADGTGLNPLLQNHPLMILHPPLLYLGFVGMAVPYAFALGSLLAGRDAEDWVVVSRPWTLGAWTALTAGLVLGARWSYDVLGWGGYWAWDPVENAALLPWLTATALVHSAMAQVRRGVLRAWTVVLAAATFWLTLFGTFVTRSGVLASVHAFTQSAIGPALLAGLAAVTVGTLAALAWRVPDVRDAGSVASVASRDALMVFNNALLLAMAATVFVGTVFPLAVDVATGQKVTVGPPFFNRAITPLGLVLLALMGAGTVLRWGRSSPADLRRLARTGGLAAVAASAAAAAGLRAPVALVAVGAVAFVALAQLDELARGVRALHRGGRPVPAAMAELVLRHRHRYAGYVVHLGMAVVVAGIVGSQAARLEVHRALRVGEVIRVGPYALRVDELRAGTYPDRLVVWAPVSVADGGTALAASRDQAPAAVLRPSQNFYRHARTPVPTPGVRSTWREDLYVVLLGFDPGAQTVVLRVVISPLVSWIWAGGAIMIVGGGLALWPPRRP
ncbi:MAG: cytochrome c-type biogenesis CcmF C-terminal domain-containing protein [Armatimonadota bacterium]|nr:cytochrome c-type biogenesis CcmF C-terminal domain-containing protein [Armatimonadota bacterium]